MREEPVIEAKKREARKFLGALGHASKIAEELRTSPEHGFMRACKAMGGEYSTEEGLLEPDVGGIHTAAWAAKKEWCDLGHLQNAPKNGLKVFRASKGGETKHVQIQSDLFGPMDSLEFETYIHEEYNPEKQEMCFSDAHTKTVLNLLRKRASTGEEFLSGVQRACVKTMPIQKYAPAKSVHINFPTWYEDEIGGTTVGEKFKFPAEDLGEYFLGSDPRKHKDYKRLSKR